MRGGTRMIRTTRTVSDGPNPVPIEKPLVGLIMTPPCCAMGRQESPGHLPGGSIHVSCGAFPAGSFAHFHTSTFFCEQHMTDSQSRTENHARWGNAAGRCPRPGREPQRTACFLPCLLVVDGAGHPSVLEPVVPHTAAVWIALGVAPRARRPGTAVLGDKPARVSLLLPAPVGSATHGVGEEEASEMFSKHEAGSRLLSNNRRTTEVQGAAGACHRGDALSGGDPTVGFASMYFVFHAPPDHPPPPLGFHAVVLLRQAFVLAHH